MPTWRPRLRSSPAAIRDPDWGPGFLKSTAYAPYSVWLYLNGNAWAKRQAIQRDIPFKPLDNEFAACEDPAALAEICSNLHAADVRAFFDRWQGALPSPLTAQDRQRGYRHELAFRQAEISDTRMFDRPPGRKTDVKDSEWICQLVQHGLVRPSFVPPPEIRQPVRIAPRFGYVRSACPWGHLPNDKADDCRATRRRARGCCSALRRSATCGARRSGERTQARCRRPRASRCRWSARVLGRAF